MGQTGYGTNVDSGNLREQLGMSREEFQEMGAIGAMFYQQGNLEKARKIFEALVALDPDSVNAHSALGAVFTRTGLNENAMLHLNRAIELDSEQIAPYVNRAEIYIRKNEMEKAVADLRHAIELDPKEADPGANRARAMVLGIHEALSARGIM